MTTPNEKRMLECLWRIAASDPTNSQFAVLVLAEVRDTIEAVTGERPPTFKPRRPALKPWAPMKCLTPPARGPFDPLRPWVLSRKVGPHYSETMRGADGGVRYFATEEEARAALGDDLDDAIDANGGGTWL